MLMNPNMSYEEKINKFKEIIKESRKIVFFGGAGVSTGSGIPDFRSPTGLYNNVSQEFSKYKPEDLLSKEFLNHNPKIFFSYYKQFMDARNYEPNIVHKYLAKLEKEEKMLGIVTQNIDMLHEKAGSEKVYKIHGTIGKNHCIKCNKEYDINTIFDSTEIIPRCNCSKKSMIRPNVTLYGEMLPKEAFNEGLKAISSADCLIVAGTSLQVYPAAGMVSDFYGKYMIILNKEETPFDSYADLVFHEDMNNVFKDLEKE